MCIIIDANTSCKIFCQAISEDFEPIANWLTSERDNGVLILCRKLVAEIPEKHHKTIGVLERASRCIIVDESIDTEINEVTRMQICKSNDNHIIALARISGARTLCSFDKKLHTDFTNKKLLNNPKGSVYQNKSHSHLLKHNSLCKTYLKNRSIIVTLK